LPKRFVRDMGPRLVVDSSSLDSEENLWLSLLEVRRRLVAVPITAVGVVTCWPVKRRRFELAASALGIDAFHFHAFASNEDAADSRRLVEGEQGQLAEILATRDYLLLGPKWEEKR